MAEHTRTARVLLPECQFDVHRGCKIGAVYVRGTERVPAGTPGATLVIPAKRCDCSCHRKAVRR